MVKTTDLTSDSVDTAAGYYDYQFAKSGGASAGSPASSSGSRVGASPDCNQNGCPEHPEASSPIQSASQRARNF